MLCDEKAMRFSVVSLSFLHLLWNCAEHACVWDAPSETSRDLWVSGF